MSPCRFKSFATALALSFLAGAAHAQLQARDINGDGSIDAFYDVQQNISWLADANYYLTAGYPPAVDYITGLPAGSPGSYMPAGSLRQWQAESWAAGLQVFGLDGWRLPQRFFPFGSDDPRCGPTYCDGWYRWPSELTVLASMLAGTPRTAVKIGRTRVLWL